MHRSILRTVGLAAFAFACCAGEAPGQEATTAAQDDYLEQYSLFAEVVAHIEQSYAAPVERRRLFEAAIRGMLTELDGHSAYLPPEEVAKYRKLMDDAPRDTGVAFAIEQGRLVVLGVREGSPAEQAGVQAGAQVLAINEQSAAELSLSEADHLLIQSSASGVRLTVRAKDGATRRFELTTARAGKATVGPAALLGEDTGYVRVTSFGVNTAVDLRIAIEKLRDDGAKAFVLDLRFNAGGLLEAAVNVTDLFLKHGDILSVIGRRGEPRRWTAAPDDVANGLPLAVLVNRYSASASEVVAAALQDNQRAKVVGERTYGKGSVQTVIDLDGGKSALKLTTAAYVRPSGENIQRFGGSTNADAWGVAPDEGLAVQATDQEFEKQLRAWRSPDAWSPNPTNDRQLQAAISALRPT